METSLHDNPITNTLIEVASSAGAHIEDLHLEEVPGAAMSLALPVAQSVLRNSSKRTIMTILLLTALGAAIWRWKSKDQEASIVDDIPTIDDRHPA